MKQEDAYSQFVRQEEEAKEIAKQLGRRGGQSTLRKHGSDHYSKIAQKRWKNEKARKAERELRKAKKK